MTQPTQSSIRQAVAQMPLDQFTAYENAIRSQPDSAFNTNPDLLTALQAVNERRAYEIGRGINVTIPDGQRAAYPENFMESVPTWGWIAAGVGAVLLVFASTR